MINNGINKLDGFIDKGIERIFKWSFSSLSLFLCRLFQCRLSQSYFRFWNIVLSITLILQLLGMPNLHHVESVLGLLSKQYHFLQFSVDGAVSSNKKWFKLLRFIQSSFNSQNIVNLRLKLFSFIDIIHWLWLQYFLYVFLLDSLNFISFEKTMSLTIKNDWHDILIFNSEVKILKHSDDCWIWLRQ